MALTPALQKFTTASPVIASYDWKDIASGEAFTTFYPFWTVTSTEFKSFRMSSTPLTVPTGTLDTTYPLFFETNGFKLPRTIKGEAFVTGFLSYVDTNMQVTAQLFKRPATGGVLGGITENDATEYSDSSGSYVTVKTFTFTEGEYVNKVVNQIKFSDENNGRCKIMFNYLSGLAPAWKDVQKVVSGTTYTEQTFSNPFPNERVSSIEIRIDSVSGHTMYVKENDVYEQDMGDINISEEVKTTTYAADINFNIPLPITETVIAAGETLTLKISMTAGNLVVDPLNLVNTTNESLKLNIPFKLDL